MSLGARTGLGKRQRRPSPARLHPASICYERLHPEASVLEAPASLRVC